MESITTKDPVLLSKVCRENFTISEIILTMLNSDTFRVKLEDLEITVLSDKKLLFREDHYTRYDVLKFFDPMYENFEKLLSECWITIKQVKVYGGTKFTFLYDYCLKNIQCNNLQLKNTDKVNIFDFDANAFKPSEIKDFLKKANKSSKVNIRTVEYLYFESKPSEILNYFNEFKPFFKKFDSFNFELKWTFTIFTDNEFDVLLLKKFYDARIKYKNDNPDVSFDDSDLILGLHLGYLGPSRINYQVDQLCSIFDIKHIKHLAIGSLAGRVDVDFNAVRKIKYIEDFIVGTNLKINYKNLGDWRDMKHLKILQLMSPGIDYTWLNDYLPPTVEKINITQFDEPSNNTKFTIPPNLKILRLGVSNTNFFDFKRFNFEKAKDLTNIHLYVNNAEFSYGGSMDYIDIGGVRKFPECVRVLTVEDESEKNFIRPPKELQIFGVSISGIYTNIGTMDKFLDAVEHR